MAEYRVTGPDGTKYKVTGPDGATDAQVLSQVKAYKPPSAAPKSDPKAVPDMPAAPAAAKPAQRVPPPLNDSTSGFVSGNLNKGIAGLLGTPVDVSRDIANLGIAAYGFGTGRGGDAPEPIPASSPGGAQWFEGLMRKGGMVDESAEPQTALGRYGAAVLRMAPGAAVGRPKPAQLPRALAVTTTSGLASESARDIGGDEWAGVGAMAPGAFKMQHKGAGERATEQRQGEAFGKARELGIPVPPSALKPDRAQQGIQNQGNKALRQPEGTEFSPQTLQAYRNSAYGDYEAVLKSPALKGGVQPTPKFQQDIQTIGNEIESARASLPETFKGMRPVIKLLSEYGYAQMPPGMQQQKKPTSTVALRIGGDIHEAKPGEVTHGQILNRLARENPEAISPSGQPNRTIEDGWTSGGKFLTRDQAMKTLGFDDTQSPAGQKATREIPIPPRAQPIPPDVAMRAIKKLRNDASTNFSSDKPEKVELARVQKRLANSIEDMIEENLARTGDQALVGKWKEARTAIGRSHDYESAMEPGGRINAQKLAALQNEGAPLSGGTEKIAQVAGAFPGAVGKPKDDTMFTQKTSPMAITHPPAVLAHQVPKWWEKGMMNPVGQAAIDPRNRLTPQQQQMIRYLSAINAQNRANQIPTPP